MAESMNSNIGISIDLKKNRIHIHKPTLHLLGNPTLIQLLFNPEERISQFAQCDLSLYPQQALPSKAPCLRA